MKDVSYIEKVRIKYDTVVICYVRCCYCRNVHHHDFGKLGMRRKYTDIRGAKCIPFNYKIVINPEAYPYFIIDCNSKIQSDNIRNHLSNLVE